jgi:D-sedoheptulose 7-phosphate isomerase
LAEGVAGNCLSNDMAMVTAVANDVGFDDVFSRQIIALGSAGDVLLGIPTSGNSENLMHAFATARRMTDGEATAARWRRLGSLVDYCLTVSGVGIHRIQESLALYHITCGAYVSAERIVG